jgi:GT2 family glycosyltransferase
VSGALPPCSVVVSTRNRPRLVLEAVRSILAGRAVPAELVVVDQSGEPNLELSGLEHPACDVRVIRSSSVGVSAAKNAGIAATTRDVLVFTDDDVLVDPEWLHALVGALARDGERTVVVGRVVAGPPEVEEAEAVSITPEGKAELHRGLLTVDPLAGNNWACFRAALAEVGTFDERLGPGARFPSADDNDLGFRLLEAGYTIRYVPEALLVHRAWRAGGDLLRLEWIYGRGQGGFLAKHMSVRDAHMLKRLKTTIAWKHPIRRRASGRDAVYLAGVLSGVAQWLVEERLLPRLTARVRRSR